MAGADSSEKKRTSRQSKNRKRSCSFPPSSYSLLSRKKQAIQPRGYHRQSRRRAHARQPVGSGEAFIIEKREGGGESELRREVTQPIRAASPLFETRRRTTSFDPDLDPDPFFSKKNTPTRSSKTQIDPNPAEVVVGVEGDYEVVVVDGLTLKRRRQGGGGGTNQAGMATPGASVGASQASVGGGAAPPPQRHQDYYFAAAAAAAAAAAPPMPYGATIAPQQQQQQQTQTMPQMMHFQPQPWQPHRVPESERLLSLWRSLIGDFSSSFSAGDHHHHQQHPCDAEVAAALAAAGPAVAAALADGTLVCAGGSGRAAASSSPRAAAAAAAAKAAARAKIAALAEEEAAWGGLAESARELAESAAKAAGQETDAAEDGAEGEGDAEASPSSLPSDPDDATGLVSRASKDAGRCLAVQVAALGGLARRADALAARADAAAARLQADWRARRFGGGGGVLGASSAAAAAGAGGAAGGVKGGGVLPGVDSPASLIRGMLAPPPPKRK